MEQSANTDRTENSPARWGNLPIATSRAVDTERAYENLVAGFLDKAATQMGIDVAAVSPAQFADWMLAQQSGWSYATWRLYRAAAIHHLETLGKSAENPAPYHEAISRIRGATMSGCLPKAEKPEDRKTSAKRPRYITQEQIEKLNQAFMSKTGRSKKGWAQATWLMFISTIIAGGRPNEWEKATMTATGVVLPNSKNTEGREKAPNRFVPLANRGDYFLISNHLECIQRYLSAGGNWAHYYKMVREYLRRIVKETFEESEARNICLYTARHQFSANTEKAAGKVVTADLMGHNSILTRRRYYSNSNFAWLLTSDQHSREASEDRPQSNAEPSVLPAAVAAHSIKSADA